MDNNMNIEKPINNENNNKEELLKLYISNNYETMINESYSYCTLLFGPYYMFYRKQYNQFILLLILQVATILSILYLNMGLFRILGLIYLLICFIMGSSFKKYYYK